MTRWYNVNEALEVLKSYDIEFEADCYKMVTGGEDCG